MTALVEGGAAARAAALAAATPLLASAADLYIFAAPPAVGPLAKARRLARVLGRTTLRNTTFSRFDFAAPATLAMARRAFERASPRARAHFARKAAEAAGGAGPGGRAGAAAADPVRHLIVQHEKIAMLKRAAEDNPYGADYFYWIDLDIAKGFHPKCDAYLASLAAARGEPAAVRARRLFRPEALLCPCNADGDKITLLRFADATAAAAGRRASVLSGLWRRHADRNQNNATLAMRHGGAASASSSAGQHVAAFVAGQTATLTADRLFGGSRAGVLAFCAAYEALLADMLINHGVVHDAQTFLGALAVTRPELFQPEGDAVLVDTFCELLDKVC